MSRMSRQEVREADILDLWVWQEHHGFVGNGHNATDKGVFLSSLVMGLTFLLFNP